MKGVFFGFLFSFSLFLGGCIDRSADNADADIFRYNESKGITSLDPAYARNQTNIWPVSQVFNGLVQLDDSLNVQPSIASEWTISPDGKIYTFTLRTDVLFHESTYFEKNDDRVVRAADFKYSFERILDPKIASPGSWIFEYVKPGDGFQVINDSTIQIQLRRPFPPFLSVLAMPYCSVVPKDVIEQDGVYFSSNPIGTGPFQFKFWSPEEKLILLKNENYFEKDADGQSLPYLDAISITFIKDKQSEFLEFLKGNLDFLSGVHAAYKDELLTRSGSLSPKYADRFKLLTQAYLNTEYLGILQEEKEGEHNILKYKDIRKAINYGFDREKMMKYLRNNIGYPATAGMIPPGLPGHLEPGSGYTYNPDLARQLVAKHTQNEDEFSTILLTTTSDYLDLCEYIQFELQKVGLEIEISVRTGAAFRNMVANGNLQFFRGSWIADYADAENYLALFYSRNFTPEGPNYTRFKSDEFDDLYEQAISITNPEVRHNLYHKMDRIVIESAAIVPLYYDKVVRIVSKDIMGFYPNPMNNLILKYVRKR